MSDISIFFSYSRQQAEIMKVLTEQLLTATKAGSNKAWSVIYDLHPPIPIGEVWWDELLNRILRCSHFVPIISADYLMSDACQKELKWALDLNKHCLPIIIDIKTFGMSTFSILSNLQQIQSGTTQAELEQTIENLLDAIESKPNTARLPEVLPAKPSQPKNNVQRIIETLNQPALTEEDIIRVVAHVRAYVREEQQRDDVLQVLKLHRDKPNISPTLKREFDEIIEYYKLLEQKRRGIFSTFEAMQRAGITRVYPSREHAKNAIRIDLDVATKPELTRIFLLGVSLNDFIQDVGSQHVTLRQIENYIDSQPQRDNKLNIKMLVVHPLTAGAILRSRSETLDNYVGDARLKVDVDVTTNYIIGLQKKIRTKRNTCLTHALQLLQESDSPQLADSMKEAGMDAALRYLSELIQRNEAKQLPISKFGDARDFLQRNKTVFTLCCHYLESSDLDDVFECLIDSAIEYAIQTTKTQGNLKLSEELSKQLVRVSFQGRLYTVSPIMSIYHTDKVSYIQPYYYWDSRKPITRYIPMLRCVTKENSDKGNIDSVRMIHYEIEHHFNWIWDYASVPAETYRDGGFHGVDLGLYQAGAVNVFNNSDDAGQRIIYLLKNAKRRVYIQGITLRTFFGASSPMDRPVARMVQREMENLILRANDENLEIKVLLLNPRSDQAIFRSYREYRLECDRFNKTAVTLADYRAEKANQKHQDHTLFRDTITSLENIEYMAQKLKPTAKQRFQYALYSSAPACFILIVDDYVLVEQYHYGKSVSGARHTSSTSETDPVIPIILGKDMPKIEFVKEPSSIFTASQNPAQSTYVENAFRLLEDHFNFVFKHCSEPTVVAHYSEDKSVGYNDDETHVDVN
jgi:hypothetical protein